MKFIKCIKHLVMRSICGLLAIFCMIGAFKVINQIDIATADGGHADFWKCLQHGPAVFLAGILAIGAVILAFATFCSYKDSTDNQENEEKDK